MYKRVWLPTVDGVGEGEKEGTAKCQEMRHDEGGNYVFNRVFIFAYHCFFPIYSPFLEKLQ